MLCIVSFIALLCAILYVKNKELVLNKQDDDLIELYHSKDNSIPDRDGKRHVAGNLVSSGGDVDCVLYLDSLGVVLPVLRGNTEDNLANFRTVVANNRMQLGKTNYGIMGHHARDMNVSLSGISKLNIGDRVKIEKDGAFYEYSVISNYTEYAEKSAELFNPKVGTSVFLFTCDYTMPGSDVAYRIVRCDPVNSNIFDDNEKSSVTIISTEE